MQPPMPAVSPGGERRDVGMAPLCYRRHRFPPEIIQHAIWLYRRFTLSYRDVEELLPEREVDISYETMRHWVLKFGPAISRRLRQWLARAQSCRPIGVGPVYGCSIKAAVTRPRC